MGGCEIYARVLTRSGEDDEDDGGEIEKNVWILDSFFSVPVLVFRGGVFKKTKRDR